ncbi:diguanylate cyclase with PAS/PAC sensor [Desulfurivibrio alkaliphilus AHT 2]|uniref:Diguanylate cyclase with PAS/PAC sensor n=1 Tax=Desulfurivibrio alkaliphilus (strain DSM 19089 / UNIQEM U267 / AHT2) TaxID=589865 RepID=D6Z444_DESAT|nr:diguanylate cyclase [Desulfurivibrio alkaliphilus]ADH86319.1 diguanylate cyclase with PAS/PAC sensor [Desulfurivibrio alkaliphilus AHT 2]
MPLESDTTYGQVSRELNRHIVNLLDSLSALSALADLPVAGLDQRELLQQALEALMENQDLERCSIFLLEEESGELINAAGLDWEDLLRGDDTPELAGAPQQRRPPRRFRLGEGIIGQAAAAGELVECRSTATDPRFKQAPQTGAPEPDGSLLCLPIRSEEGILGVLNVFYPAPNYFTLWHQRLLRLFCTMLGRLLSNRELFDEMEMLVERRTRALQEANTGLQNEVQRRQQAEEELAGQHAFLQTVIDGCAEPIMVIAKDHRVLWMNRAARTITEDGRGQEFCYQVSHRRDTPCRPDDEHPCPLQMVLNTGEATRVVHEYCNAAGDPRAMEVLATPFLDAEDRLAGIIESGRDITERVLTESNLRRQQEELHAKAYYDPLTGLPNRQLFNLRLHHLTRRHEGEAALLFIDLDGFKAINDRHGHLFADQLLRVVGKRLRQAVRQKDMVARFAGDEFVVLLESLHNGPGDAEKVAEKLLAAMARPMNLEEQEVQIGASIGLALFPTDAADPEQLLEKADAAMFAAKKAGKHTWRHCSAS